MAPGLQDQDVFADTTETIQPSTSESSCDPLQPFIFGGSSTDQQLVQIADIGTVTSEGYTNLSISDGTYIIPAKASPKFKPFFR